MDKQSKSICIQNKKPFVKQSKTEMKNDDNSCECHEPYTINATLNKFGYKIHKNIGSTLQGKALLCKTIKTDKKVVIKITSKELHKYNLGIISGRIHKIDEDILKEVNIIKYLSNKKPVNGLYIYRNIYYDILYLF